MSVPRGTIEAWKTDSHCVWNKYEAAILLEALVATINGSLSRSDALKHVSDCLRKMAVNKGITIDEAYRNIGGITFHLSSMESAFQGKGTSVKASRLFIDVVNMYRSSPR